MDVLFLQKFFPPTHQIPTPVAAASQNPSGDKQKQNKKFSSMYV